ncbi:cell adhesion molecule-related/down-regulated by oncogenes [Syngnathus typhle]|uniref:cell adhesion molecule-related/down-regulated by oncogenes n=1 Tax=Syngnathus typhle TaxID=161592 RepID=UPI002A6B46DE|nr:cell adhesion molecule-related/down-regulated by oncogenes [Syngnathus typhle]XP_061136217.1 cell adhesion molecule-related/down-regulated by oncogenes [Syngnathus typhle]XP_061136218.1 cell adhesion molecule-related/down-regulated by oncogenes [Syngnathus typhle]XP_061136219.1 cell adhesion molecule-related/down-regulated by oncogenes [Syngnathus typhle]XP_061136221.1 cell adhesion molecule-related/down-regulated by oncogenes [Syngnathus typhle]XP_061136222.1 cell adhesion molecule-related
MDGGLRVFLSTLLCLSQDLLVTCTLHCPSFRSEPASLVQSPGSPARLRCATNPQSAELSWRFRGEPLLSDTLPGVELNDGTLTIANLQRAHVGVYQCVARSGHGLAVASRYARVDLAEISQYEDSRRRSLSVQVGDAAIVECPLPRSVPPAFPRLRVRGERVEASTDDYLVLPSGNLQIPSASLHHRGVYKCGSYNPVTGETVMQTHGTKISVRHADSPSSPARIVYPTSPKNVTLQRSQSYTLECVVSGSPAPSSTWFKNGERVRLGPSLRHLRDNLEFVSVTTDDNGVYVCAVESEQGTVMSANYTVNILEPASILVGLADQRVAVGSTARFSCVAAGSPAPDITWLFNAEPVPASHRVRISEGQLVISGVVPRDQGVYQCLLDNDIGSAQSSGMLSVQSDLNPGVDVWPSLPPMQSDEGGERFLTEEEDEPPSDGGALRLTPDAPIITSPPQTYKPDIYDLEWRAGPDGGSPINAYFVKYRKVDEMATLMESWLTVRVPGSERSLRLSELEASSLYEVLMVARSSAGEGQPAMLTFRTGKEKSASSNKNPSHKPPVVLMPPKVPEDKMPNTHFGVVIHDRVPEAPDRPTISMATESSVYVTWIPRANGGSPITAFRVEYKRSRNTEWGVAADNISPLKLSVEVRNLEPGATYRFRVTAMNLYGESPRSVASRPYQVPQASPRMADRPVVGPHISATDAISDTQIMLRWTYSPSSNNNTPIQGFYIYYRPTDSDNDSDYKRDVVEGGKDWHMIGHLQAETSYDIKMQCFNDGGESDYSNVMICETRARQSPGSPSQRPVTPPWPHPQEPSGPPGGLLYLIVGCVLGVMVLILLAFIAMCLWRNRQHNNMHKYDPPGYLYQPADINGHVLEYTALAGTGRMNGGVHGGFGHGGGGAMLPSGCHHLHHKHPNGLPLHNSNGGLYPGGHSHGHDGTLPHPHHHHNGGGMYTALPQSESSDCVNCQNLCNNNRCYKPNGVLTGGTLPLMHRAAPCQQDGLEMVPLKQAATSPCRHRCSPAGELRADDLDNRQVPHPPDEQRDSSPSQRSCCLEGDDTECPGDGTAEEDLDCVDQDCPIPCWENLGLPDSDCDEKPCWMSGGGELIQASLQEV